MCNVHRCANKKIDLQKKKKRKRKHFFPWIIRNDIVVYDGEFVTCTLCQLRAASIFRGNGSITSWILDTPVSSMKHEKWFTQKQYTQERKKIFYVAETRVAKWMEQQRSSWGDGFKMADARTIFSCGNMWRGEGQRQRGGTRKCERDRQSRRTHYTQRRLSLSILE